MLNVRNPSFTILLGIVIFSLLNYFLLPVHSSLSMVSYLVVSIFLPGYLVLRLIIKDGKGGVPAVEIMLGSSAVRHQIRDGKVAMIPATMQTSKQMGMQTMDAALIDLYNAGVVDMDVILPHLSSPEALDNQPEKA